ncbi:MAG TPA: hypothetical protein VF630_20095 [Hymenobacter sp.]|jgi:hypothetical protein
MRPTLLVLCLAAAMGAGACSGTHESSYDRAAPPRATVISPPSQRVPQVDVPALLGLSIDDINKRMGPRLPLPPGFFDPALLGELKRGAKMDSTALFRSEGLAMVVSYDFASRQVSDFLLLGENENELMARARLKLGADDYLVLPVYQAQRASQLFGVRVLANSPNQ